MFDAHSLRATIRERSRARRRRLQAQIGYLALVALTGAVLIANVYVWASLAAPIR